MKGTKLWTQAGSPLILGRSRRQKPFSTTWAQGTIASLFTALVAVVALLLYKGPVDVSVLLGMVVPLTLGSAIGSLVGAWFALKAGSLRAWVSGAVVGFVLALATAWGFALLSVELFGT